MVSYLEESNVGHFLSVYSDSYTKEYLVTAIAHWAYRELFIYAQRLFPKKNLKISNSKRKRGPSKS